MIHEMQNKYDMYILFYCFSYKVYLNDLVLFVSKIICFYILLIWFGKCVINRIIQVLAD